MKGYCKMIACMGIAALTILQMTGCGRSSNASGSSEKTEEESKHTEEGSKHMEENAAGETKDSVSDAVEHLLIVWSDYLTVLDQMYASELWALDYMDAFLESGDWKDLTKARTACIASVRFLTELSMTEEDLTEEEYLALAGAGIDTGYQKTEFSTLADELEQAHLIIRDRLLEGLEYDVFSQSSIEILKQEAETERDYISCMSRYICNETNYLLLSLGQEEIAAAYWAEMPEKYPVLSKGCGEWLASEAELKAAADKYLDEYEDNILRKSDLIASMNAEVYNMTRIVENKDLEKLQASAYPMTNTPEFLPMPVWYDPGTTGYLSFILNGDDSISYPASGEELPDTQYGMYIQVKGIGEEEIEAYLAYAENYAWHTWKGEDKDAWYIAMEEYNVRIELGDETVTFLFNGEDVTFAPEWYIAQ